jgi:hypothetical protein
MDRGSRQRIWKLERLLSKTERLLPAVLTKLEKSQLPLETAYSITRHTVRVHATAVAAIAMWGEPKIDEPLICAWKRTLAYHGLDREDAIKGLKARSILTGLLFDRDRDDDIEWRQCDELRATQKIYPLIVDDHEYRSSHGWWNPHIVHASEPARFTEVFRTAPVWLLEFTNIQMDAPILEFDLPDLSDELSWGVEGVKDAARWPLLPLGTIAAGDPVCAVAEEFDGLSSKERRFYEEIQKRPREEWSRFERRRAQQLVKRLSPKNSMLRAKPG